MATFKCRKSGVTLEVVSEVDIHAMKMHPEYIEVKEDEMDQEDNTSSMEGKEVTKSRNLEKPKARRRSSNTNS